MLLLVFAIHCQEYPYLWTTVLHTNKLAIQSKTYILCLALQISQQLERDQTQWFANDVDGKGFLSNEIGTSTGTESYHSPQSQWSETSGKCIIIQYNLLLLAMI